MKKRCVGLMLLSKKGEHIVFKFRQRWGLVDGPGKQPLIQAYLVEPAN